MPAARLCRILQRLNTAVSPTYYRPGLCVHHPHELVVSKLGQYIIQCTWGPLLARQELIGMKPDVFEASRHTLLVQQLRVLLAASSSIDRVHRISIESRWMLSLRSSGGIWQGH